MHQPGGDAGHRVLAADLGRLAGGEHHERDLLAVQQVAKEPAGTRSEAVGGLEQQMALAARRGGRRALQRLRPAARPPRAAGNRLRVDAMAVEMQQVHRRRSFVEPRDQRLERGRAQELGGDAAGGEDVDRVQHRQGVGARVDEAGMLRPADDEQQMQRLLRRGAERRPPAAGGGQPPAHRNARCRGTERCRWGRAATPTAGRAPRDGRSRW